MAYILHMFGTRLFLDTTTNKVHLRWLPLLEDLDVCGAMSWGSTVLAYLYMVLYKNQHHGDNITSWLLGTPPSENLTHYLDILNIGANNCAHILITIMVPLQI